ncbi:MAG: ribosome-associated translation inhibitor RaiA [Candidatus Pacebacteria bacterium]|nr:ribosome-associated translation inhibitor RaiA [Candidatus Paceibacterota bacterium]
MTFPTINYKFNGLAEAQALTDIVEQKCVAFEKYLRDKSDVICDVEFKKVAPQQNGQIHRVEVNLSIDGHLYRAVATEESFEKAIDEVRDEVEREIKKAKEKHETLHKQGGREVKEQMMAVE